MKVNGHLDDASFELVVTADEPGLDKTVGRVYYNTDTEEMLVGDGVAFIRFSVPTPHPAFPVTDPIGTIKSSILSESAFQTQIGDLTWLLCDGQTVPAPYDTIWNTVTGLTEVPDYRGLFLRMRNYGRTGALADPAGDAFITTTRLDSVGPHSHNVDLFPPGNGSGSRARIASTTNLGYAYNSSIPGWQNPWDKNPRTPIEEEMRQVLGLPGTDTTNTLIEDETRPKHTIVNYFMKVGY